VSIKKTYLTTDQFIKVYKSLSDEKLRELGKARDEANSAARYAARDANLAILAKDKTTKEQFNILTHPWTSCGLSLYAEDWEAVLNPKVENKLLELLDQRQEDYGDAKDNFTAIGRMWGALLKIEDIPDWQVALMMDAFKSVRCFANPLKDDSWDDKSGYIHHARDLRPERDGE